jgi:adenine-specific DNA-methyltransferase
MDEVFGKKQFRNEIIWHYSGWNKALLNSFEKRHDTIFLYGKTDNQFFASYAEPYKSKEEYLTTRKQKLYADESGRVAFPQTCRHIS